jgi:hypothetical protein
MDRVHCGKTSSGIANAVANNCARADHAAISRLASMAVRRLLIRQTTTAAADLFADLIGTSQFAPLARYALRAARASRPISVRG